MRIKSERTQTGNPYGLSIKQHVFPARSIERFTSVDGKVHVGLLRTGSVKRLAPKSDLFCLKRAWDHRTETSFMKSIEDRFQSIADGVVAHPDCQFEEREQESIRQFFALWRFRSSFEPLPEQHLQLVDCAGLSKDQEERLERNGYAFIREGGVMPSRQLAGPILQTRIGRLLRQIADRKWAVVWTDKGDFVVPDEPSIAMVPLSPTLALYMGNRNGSQLEADVADVNKRLLLGSKKYVFARDLRDCPGIFVDGVLGVTRSG